MTCGVCTDWEFDHPLLFKKLSTMSKKFTYPYRLEPGSPPSPKGRSIGVRESVVFEPIQLSYGWMKEAVKCCFYNHHVYCHGRHLGTPGWTKFGWNKGDSKNYMRSCTLNVGLWDNISSLAMRYSHLPTAEAMEFCDTVIPAVWKRPGVDIQCHLDAAFHMVFHGVFVDVIELISSTLQSIDIRALVFEKIKGMLAKLRDIHHPELPLLPFKNKKGDPFGMSSWMGSQKVAFSRIMHYCFTCSSNVAMEKYSHDDQRSKREKAIRFCGLIEDLTLSYSAVASRIMQKEALPEITTEVKEYVKLFLSSYSLLEIALRDGNLTQEQEEDSSPRTKFDPKWNTAGNFPSMLNLSTTIAEFGSIRLFWDASDERLVQWLKPHCRTAALEGTQTWKRTALQHITDGQTLDIVMKKGDMSTLASTHVKLYKSREEMESYIAAKDKPLLIYEMVDEPGYFSCFYRKEGGTIGSFDIKTQAHRTKYVGNVQHVGIEFYASTDTYYEATLTDILKVAILCIPEIGSEVTDYWFLSTLEWRIYNDGTMVLSKLRENMVLEG
jgi:hypothetical protein